MSQSVVETEGLFEQEDQAKWVANLWDKWNTQRSPQRNEVQELRNFLFATDTTTTSVDDSTDWNNKTTYPKLCQIRDNLESNYMKHLFPSRDWLDWQGDSQEDSVKTKANAIEAYMKTKVRKRGSNFKNAMKQGILDYIDEGNVFFTAEFADQKRTNAIGDEIVKYRGPRVKRIHPDDIVFDPKAESFYDSNKVVRSIVTLGELELMGQDNPDMKDAVEAALLKRDEISKKSATFTRDDWRKVNAFAIDGFGSLSEYYISNTVEILQFFGSFYDSVSKKVMTNQKILVLDRMFVIASGSLPGWMATPPIFHAGWRKRDRNLWAMGPLANLVGMQYRIDHLANLKADAMDLVVDPPLQVKGDVEEFFFAPGTRIEVGETGSVTEVAKSLNGVIAAEGEIQALENRMEVLAGAPREAMGVRSPGEKTAFEVAELSNAASQIFQEKIKQFEEECLEPLLDYMLEISVRHLSSNDVEQALKIEDNRKEFLKVTREDLMASGQFSARGASHFSEKSQLVQNLNNLANSNMMEVIRPHLSGKAMTKLLEDALNIERFGVFSENIAVAEQMETQSLMNTAQEELAVEDNIEDDLQL
jgi:hypothetical protein